ncbi:MAG: Diguanylate phosphodiesterase [Frankiales bacterium]|nr:Diguanylate phosphodiesterase [Frankiales bacterium]
MAGGSDGSTVTASGAGAGVVARPRPGRWALPPRPPEEWVGPVWAAVLTLLLGVAVVVPLTGLLRTQARTADDVEAALLGLLAAGACACAAYALLVQGNVRADPRLSWLAGGPLLLHPAVLVHGLLDPSRLARTVPLLALLVLPLLALTSPLARRMPVLGVPALLLSALLAGGAVTSALWSPVPGRAALALGLVPAALGLAVWLPGHPHDGTWGVVAVALAVVPAVLVLRLGVDADLPLGLLPLAVLALGLGLPTATGYTRQSRRWRELEQEVRDSRIPTALLPGRSVTPEDDEGLPEPAEVQQVLDTSAVAVALQPVLRLTDGAVVGQEALARFGGRIPTDRWFRGASRYGLGLELERLCLRAAVGLLPSLPPEEFLAVNVSPAALADERTLAVLHAADLERVVVEVTEHEAVADYPGMRSTLARLREQGARIAVDDTGAGYASLRHVLLLQPEVVKLDTALVRDLQSDPRKRALVVALTSFAHEVGSTVLAEGIETQGQVDALLEIGVDLGQGWHLGVPAVPGERPPRV